MLTGIYKWLAILAIIAGVVGTIVYLSHRVKLLTEEVSVKTNNLKSYKQGLQTYQDQNGNLHNQVIQMQSSLSELKSSKDLADKALLDSLKKYKINPKEVTQAGQVTTVLKHDTTVSFIGFRDTTVDLSHPPYITNIIDIKDSKLSNELDITNVQTLAWKGKRETVNPPSKFFFIRWFQKKQTVTEADIVNSNPYIHTISQHFTLITK